MAEWGLITNQPGMGNAGGNAFSEILDRQQQREMQRQQMLEQRRQFDMNYGLNKQSHDLSQRQFGLNQNQDRRAEELHKFKVDEGNFERVKRADEILGRAHELYFAAGNDPAKRQQFLAQAAQLGADPKMLATYGRENGWRYLGESMKRAKQNTEQGLLKFQAENENIRAQAEERRATADQHRATADKIRQQQDDPIDQLLRQRLGQVPSGQRQPPVPMLSPTPSMPGPRLIPQAAPGPDQGGDQNLIPIQATPGRPTQPLSPPKQMVTVPGIGQVERDVAEAMLFKYARDKNEPMSALLNQALNAVPKALQDDVGKKQLESIDQVSRLDGIRSSFKPEWQTWEMSLKQQGLNLADSFESLRDKIPPEQRASMADFTTFKAKAMSNLNLYIKEITGAAMSEMEANRIRQAMPDPQKDSPTQFKAKLDNSIALSKLALARYTLMRERGFNGDINALAERITLEQMPDIINKRGAEIEQQLKQANPNVPQPQIDQGVRQRIKKEFGI